MSNYAFIGAGAPSRAFNAALTPALPSGYVAGNLLLMQSEMVAGSISASTLTVTGWTLIAPASGDSTTKCIGVWARIATGSDSVSVNWGTIGTDSIAWVVAYSGNPASLSGIVHAQAGRSNNANGELVYPNITITAADCLILLCGTKNNVTASQSATFGAVQNNGTWAIDQSIVENLISPDVTAVTNRQIQTTATSISSATQTMSIADGTTQQYNTVSIALYSATTSFAATGALGSSGTAFAQAAGAIQARGIVGSSGIASSVITQILGSGSGSTGVASLFNLVIPGSIAAPGISGSQGAAQLIGAGALTLLGLSGASANFTLIGESLIATSGLSGSQGIASLQSIIAGNMQAMGFAGDWGKLSLLIPIPPIAPPGYGVMPYVIGELLWEAIAILQAAGVLVPSAIGYFGEFPVSVIWIPQVVPPSGNNPLTISGTSPFTVTAQSLASGLLVKANTPIALTAYEPPTGVIFP